MSDCRDRKDVEGKILPLLIPYEAMVAYCKVSDVGNRKYGNRDSWRFAINGVETYSNAAARHLFQNGLDSESGLPHLYHTLWNVAAAIWHYEKQRINPEDFIYPGDKEP